MPASIAPLTTSTTPAPPGVIYQIAISEAAPGPGYVTENYDYTSIYVGNSYSVNDNLTWAHGRHTFKAGAEFRYIQMNQDIREDGKITFSSVANLAADAVRKASLKGALPVNGLRKNDYFLYAQDEYKWRPNLTFNLGLRYTIFGLFDEKNGQAEPFDFATCGPQGYCSIGASFGNQNYGDVDPRVAFAWTPRISEKTVIRGGFGLYHEDGQLDDQNLPAGNEVPSYSASSSSSTLAYCPPATCPIQAEAVRNQHRNQRIQRSGTYAPSAEQRDRKDTYVEQWSFSVQQELPASFVGTVSYLGSHGVHLLEEGETNLLAYDSTTGAYGPQIAISGVCPERESACRQLRDRHSVARLGRHEHLQRSLCVHAPSVLPRLAGGGQLYVVARNRQRLQRQRRWRRDTAGESGVPVLRNRQRRMGRAPCGQRQCGLPAPLRPRQGHAQSARNCQRHCGQLGVDLDGAGAHRFPGQSFNHPVRPRRQSGRYAAPSADRSTAHSARWQNGRGVVQSRRI